MKIQMCPTPELENPKGKNGASGNSPSYFLSNNKSIL